LPHFVPIAIGTAQCDKHWLWLGWHMSRRTRTASGLHVLCGSCFIEWWDGGEKRQRHTCKIKDKRKMTKEFVVFFAPSAAADCSLALCLRGNVTLVR